MPRFIREQWRRGPVTVLIVVGVLAAAVTWLTVMATTSSGASYPTAVQDGFLASCEIGGSADQCHCTLQRIEGHVPLREFVAAASSVTPPSWVYDDAKACR